MLKVLTSTVALPSANVPPSTTSQVVSCSSSRRKTASVLEDELYGRVNVTGTSNDNPCGVKAIGVPTKA